MIGSVDYGRIVDRGPRALEVTLDPGVTGLRRGPATRRSRSRRRRLLAAARISSSALSAGSTRSRLRLGRDLVAGGKGNGQARRHRPIHRPGTAGTRSTAGLRLAARRHRRTRSTSARAGKATAMASKPQTVLVVEDEASIASFVAAYLKNAGYAVRTTASGIEALKLVESEKPALVVLDLMLPDIDGVEVCKRIRQSSDLPGADADRARRGRRQDHRPRGRRRRLHDEAVQSARARRAGTRDSPPRDARAAARREAAVLEHGDLAHRRGPARGARRRAGDPARAEGVRPALGAARPSRPRPHARPAARARLGLHVRGRHAHRRRARAPASPQARRCVADRDGLGRRLQGRARRASQPA